jgi:lipoprotein-releasing system ATP-binding protein
MTELVERAGAGIFAGQGEPLLQLRAVEKSYLSGSQPVRILANVDLQVFAGEILAVVGPSGSGKTSLLNLIAGLDRPEGGSILFQGRELTSMSDDQWATVRGRHMGFVFQFHQLLPEFSALENVMIPGLILRRSEEECRIRASELLAQVGLADRLAHQPARLSGGEQQRVAVARALMNRPALVLADEPTGNLDGRSANALFDLIRALREEHGMAFLFVTHNPELAERCDRMFALGAGLSRVRPEEEA